MGDKENQERYKIYLTQFDKVKCPNCRSKLDVKVRETVDKKDDLYSVVDLFCSQCHWSSNISKLYRECIS